MWGPCIILLIVFLLRINKLERKIMSTYEEVVAALEAGKVSTLAAVAAVEAQVEALFAALQGGGATPEQLDELKANIQGAFSLLTSGVEAVGVDDPNT
jgi:hypothetical protein